MFIEDIVRVHQSNRSSINENMCQIFTKNLRQLCFVFQNLRTLPRPGYQPGGGTGDLASVTCSHIAAITAAMIKIAEKNRMFLFFEFFK